ncbi:MAG TPA: kelch repeat-containing protein [Bryobacteraceae bacterium]|nr:kelch repeat-containing protein [Bryobacteraceae bacterium]
MSASKLPFCCCLGLTLVAGAFAQEPNWTQQSPHTSPPARQYLGLVYDSARSQILLFAGINGANSGPFNDTWTWDGTDWAQKSPPTSPPARYSFAMAFDAAHNLAVIFGGVGTDGTDRNDTWVWDGTTWTQKLSPSSPSDRDSHSLVYDAARQQVVLFGGYDPDVSADLNDTWIWNGTGWTQKSVAISPEARDSYSMVYDAAHQQVVLFGGVNHNHVYLNDTWVWDGTAWTQKTAATSPPARIYSTMAFDAAQGQVVLFGGAGNSGDFNDTWTWDGTNWTQQSPATQPPTRNSQGMAYDAGHSQIVLFGGGIGNTQNVLGDTWTWSGASAPNPTISTVISASAFGGFAAAAPGSWVEIYGSGLAPDTRGWAGDDFNGNDAPTSLDGVSVTIGGQKGFVAYISSAPGQVNAQLPSNIPTGGPLALTVTNGSAISNAVNITINPTQSGLLAPVSFLVAGKQYVVALLPDNATYVLPTGAIAGVGSRPAHPGDTITMYGVGFGPLNPTTPAGTIATKANSLASSLDVMFGSTPADVTYAGSAPGFVGLYQFDVVVPSVPDNNLTPLSFKLGGTAGAQTLYIAVHK